MDKKFAKEIYSNLKLSKLHFNISIDKIGEFSKDCAEYIIFNTGNAKTPALKWCMSTVKKTKVFTQICYASSNNLPIYKEELAKKIPEYSYKTLATIVDEGIEKGYYITEEPQDNDLSDKKIKNIRTSKELLIEFLNWHIDRIRSNEEYLKKYK